MRDLKKIKTKNIALRLKEFEKISGDKKRTEFIYSLEDLIKKEGSVHFSATARFICENINTDSEILRAAVVKMCSWLISSISDHPGKEEKKNLCNLTDRIIGMMEDNYKEEFSFYEEIKDLPSSVYKSLEIIVNKILLSKVSYRRAYEAHIKETPSFMECTWKKTPCNKKGCPVCSDRSFTPNKNGEMFSMVMSSEHFTYLSVAEWSKELFDIVEDAEEEGDFWMFTQAASELFWYSNVIVEKCLTLTKEDYLSFERNYARYVSRECLRIIKGSLKEIISFDPLLKEELEELLSDIYKIEKELICL